MSVRIETKLIADGRRLATRAIVLQSLQSIPCYVFRKVILPVPDSPFANRDDETWGGIAVLSDTSMEQHAFDYQPLGHAMITVEQFLGGVVHDNHTLIQPDEITTMGLVEPYDPKLTRDERLRNMPDWVAQNGDLFCMLLGKNHYIYMECVGRVGSSLMADFGVKYAFNQKFDLPFLPTFDESLIQDVGALG